MDNDLKIKMYSFTLDCKEPYQLASFYAALLEWQIVFSDENWACVGAPETHQGSYPGILFQYNPNYQAPIWPDKPDAQQQMAHLDFIVNDLEKSVLHAINCGATIAEDQFSDSWKVMFDPAGHPFCLCLMNEVIQSPHFALR